MKPLSIETVIHVIAAGVSLLVAASLPLLTYIEGRQAVLAELSVQASAHANVITDFVNAYPVRWENQEHRLNNLIHRSHDPKRQVELYKNDRELVVAARAELVAPVIAVRELIYDYGQPVGSLVVSASLREVLAQTAAMALLGLLLASAIYFPMRMIPLRALRRSQAELERVNADLERRVEMRTGELASAMRDMSESRTRYHDLFVAQQAALTEIARDELLSQGDVQAAFAKITQTASTVMGVARVSIWRFAGDRKVLRCFDLYEASTRAHTAGMELRVEDYPKYFAALERNEVIDAVEARIDPRTREFAEGYLVTLDISSMLDIPLFLRGRLDGVICFEQVGEPLKWQPEHSLFGTALAHLAEIAQGHFEQRRAERALVESEATLSVTFQQAAVGMGIFRLCPSSPGWSRVNQKFCDMLGYDPDELLGESLHDITMPEDRAESDDVVRRLASGDLRQFSRERRYRRKDGGILWARVFGAVVELGEHQTRHAIIVVEDITQNRAAALALAESEQRMRALLDGIPDLVWLQDLEGRYVSVNRARQSALGIPEEEVIGKSVFDLFPREVAEAYFNEDREVVRTAKTIIYERRSSLTGAWSEVIKSPVVDDEGAVTGIVGIMRDITHRRVAEDERRSRDLAQRQAFVREIHHRIKNHVQGVAGMLMGHARRVPALSPEIHAAVSQLQSVALIHGLQGTSGSHIGLGDMTRAICDSLRGFAAGRAEITFSPATVDLPIHGEEAVPVALIINELLMNAIKHSQSEAKVQVSVDIAAAPDSASLCVRNPGRLPSRVQGQGAGAGHGLGIVRSLVPSQGAEFSIVQTGVEVCATLTLREPVVRLAQAAMEEIVI